LRFLKSALCHLFLKRKLNNEQIYQGAEAKIFLNDKSITKERFRKTYRITELDNRLRKSRTKREAKVLTRLFEKQFPVPKVISIEEMKLDIEYIPGDMVKDYIENKENDKLDSCIALFKEIGGSIATMHHYGIIHHDLTTSNMILNKINDKVYFIDFGLSFFSETFEDKAVDLHLMKHAIESKHYVNSDAYFDAVIKGYKQKSIEALHVLKRLEKVESRGRNKGKH